MVGDIMALKKFAKLDFGERITRTGVENHSIFFSLKQEGQVISSATCDKSCPIDEHAPAQKLLLGIPTWSSISRRMQEPRVPLSPQKYIDVKRAVMAQGISKQSAPEPPRKGGAPRSSLSVTPEKAWGEGRSGMNDGGEQNVISGILLSNPQKKQQGNSG
jgi:hypothetical protein